MTLCYICKFSVKSINSLKFHYSFKHKKNLNSNYLCSECPAKSYTNWNGIRKHLKLVHHLPNQFSDVLNYGATQSSMEVDKPEPLPLPSDNESVESSDAELDAVESECVDQDSVPVEESVKLLLISFMCKLYNDTVIPRNRVQTIMEETCSILSHVLSNVQDTMSDVLHEAGVKSDVFKSVSNHFETLQSPLSNFSSEHLRFKTLQEKGFMVDRTEFPIESVLTNFSDGEHIRVRMGYVSGQFLSMKQTLKNFLQLPNVYSTICSELSSDCPDDGLIRNYIHSPHWRRKKNTYFADKLVVPLTLYYDEVQTDKPNSHHSAEEGAMYYSVAALPPEFQSAVQNIFTACLFNGQDKKDFGCSKVFKKVIKELNDLQNHGVPIVTSEGEVTVYFTVGLIVADNLALHSLLGFIQGFSANFPCRTCHVPKEVLHSMLFEDGSLLRDPIQHTADLLLNDASQTGVIEKSAFCDLNFFNPLDNPSADLLHDVWGGGALYDMQHILYHCVNVAKYFSVDVLNFRIMTFKFDIGSNKVPQFSIESINKKHLRLTGSETLALVFSLGVLVGDLVTNPSDPVWLFYLTLRKIVDLITMRYVRLDTLKILAVLIAEHHQYYVMLFNDTLKPKHHIWLHFCRFMSEVGPLGPISCLRFEARHQPLVQTARATRSRRNISLTLCIKEQLRLANRFMNGDGLKSSLVYGPTIANYDHIVKKFECLKDAVQYKYVKQKGILYKKGVCVVVDVTDDGIPQFAVVQQIFVRDSNVIFVCCFLETHNFSSHMHAYHVTFNFKKHCVNLVDLRDPFGVMLSNSSDGNSYVTLRTAIL